MKNLLLTLCVVLVVPLLSAGQSSSPAGTKRALLIGVSHYVPSTEQQRTIPPTYKVDSRFDPGMSWIDLPASLDDVHRFSTQVLQTLYGFPPANIRILPEEQATHDGILGALDQLVADTQPNDTVVFYFAGHGSQRIDSLSSRNQRDQTIVPVDAWHGGYDVRDKELAIRFNQIVYDKGAHLTAIFDSCDSATQGRGIVPVIAEALAYDDRDVKDQKEADPRVVVESDLKQIPQDGNAVILAAAGPERSAYQARFAEDGQWHGVFTWALTETLTASPERRSADEVMNAVQARIRDNTEEHPNILFQQVSLEGRHNQSLFGDPVPPHPLRATITAIPGTDDDHPRWQLEPGSAGGFDVGSEFEALDQKSGSRRSLLRIVAVDGPSISTAELAAGDADISLGQTFELKKVVYAQPAELTVFISAPMDQASPTAVEALFPNLTWVADPSLETIDYLVVHEDRGWIAYKEDGTALPAGPSAKGKAYLVLPPPQALISQLQMFPPYVNKAYTLTSRLIEANYLLATRAEEQQPAEFALVDPVVLAPREAGAFVHSPTTTTQAGDAADIDLRLSRAGSNEAVCRNDISLPVRTAWLHEEPNDKPCDGLAFALTRRIVRLGKVRSLLTETARAPVLANWPYTLSLTALNQADPAPGLPLHSGSTFAIGLKADGATLDAYAPEQKYLYLFGASCAGDLAAYYPPGNLNGVGEQPVQENGHWQANMTLLSVADPGLSYPLGADTFFLMALPEQKKLIRPEMLTDDGNLCAAGSRGALMDSNAFLSALGKASAAEKQQGDWTMQQIVVPSRPQ